MVSFTLIGESSSSLCWTGESTVVVDGRRGRSVDDVAFGSMATLGIYATSSADTTCREISLVSLPKLSNSSNLSSLSAELCWLPVGAAAASWRAIKATSRNVGEFIVYGLVRPLLLIVGLSVDF